MDINIATRLCGHAGGQSMWTSVRTSEGTSGIRTAVDPRGSAGDKSTWTSLRIFGGTSGNDTAARPCESWCAVPGEMTDQSYSRKRYTGVGLPDRCSQRSGFPEGWETPKLHKGNKTAHSVFFTQTISAEILGCYEATVLFDYESWYYQERWFNSETTYSYFTLTSIQVHDCFRILAPEECKHCSHNYEIPWKWDKTIVNNTNFTLRKALRPPKTRQHW